MLRLGIGIGASFLGGRLGITLGPSVGRGVLIVGGKPLTIGGSTLTMRGQK